MAYASAGLTAGMRADHPNAPFAARMDPTKGLFRTTLAGQGRAVNEAFARLERVRDAERAVHHPGRNMFGARMTLDTNEGRGYWDFMRARDDLYVVVENFSFHEPRLERIADDGLLQFYFELSGDLTLEVPGETLHLDRPSLLVYSQPAGTELAAWTAPSARQQSVIINVRPRYLLDTFLSDCPCVPLILQSLLDLQQPSVMPYHRLPLTADMIDLVTRIVEARYSGVLGLLNTEALVVELLCAGVAHLGLPLERLTQQYSARQVRALHAARDLVLERVRNPPTVRELARAAGLNETTLKRGFRAVFGETPANLSLNCRMQRALELLRDHSLPVAEVAEAVGYGHATTFATAFRQHFGMQPKRVRVSRGVGLKSPSLK